MSGTETLWATPAAQAIAWALVHFLWQGALVGLAAAAALSLLKKSSAAVRYAVAAGALLLMVALPVATAVHLAGSPATPFAGSSLGQTSPSSPGVGGVEGAGEEGRGDEGFSAAIPSPFLPSIFGLWLAGVAFLSIYHLGGFLQTRRLTRTGNLLDGDLGTTVRSLSRRLGIARAVRLLESATVPVPAVIGWLRPVILIPASALAGLSPQQLEAVLAHELAHVRRHDYLINLLQAAVETLLFYHPAVWWVSSQMRRERENCCDDLAVAICGDRLGYARALADLEGLRMPSPRLAMAADGGSLLDRIRRLVGAPAPRPRRSWLAGVVALSLLPAGMTFNFAHGAASPDDMAVSASAGEEKQAPADSRQGTWSAERKGDKVDLEMSMSWGGGHHRWSMGETYAAKDLPGLAAGPNVHFELRRDAGTFRFEGKFKGDQGSGFFTFAGNPGYIRDMAALGYKMTEDRLLEMATHDVFLSFVREIHDLGYRDASLDKLVEFRIHGVSPQFIRELTALGYANLPADKLVEFRIHGVSADFVRGMAADGYKNVPADRLVEFRIHGVSPEFIHGLAADGYRDLPADKLVEFRIHGVSPEFVKELAAAGYSNMPADRLVEFRIHGVNGAFIKQAVGRYGKLSADELVQLKIRGRLDR
ncbi:MAG TPA: M56 family metallopeptidase [Thermoanaerobaculia bacterium]|jgi:beta-lactamase regulating signal transducer with metallopeptidase domain|nr:M56 family metallopeptidase [Thermoanaerobaculia bacterium]